MSNTNTTPNDQLLIDVATEMYSCEQSLELINQIHIRTDMNAKFINQNNVNERIWNAIVKSNDEINPSKIDEYALEFEANPYFKRNKPRVQDMIKWCSAAEKFYESQAKIAVFVLYNYKAKIRATREKMERVITDTNAREVLYNTIYVHHDTQLVASINRMPYDIVSLIGEFLPQNLKFSVWFPSIEEMKATLSKITVPKLKKFHEYIADRHRSVDGSNPDEFRKNIGSIKLKAYADKVITSCYIHPQGFNWGTYFLKRKDDYINTIVGYVKVYEYYANVFKTVAAKPDFQMNKEYIHYTNVFQNEALHIIKFMRFLSRQKKVRRRRVVRVQE